MKTITRLVLAALAFAPFALKASPLKITATSDYVWVSGTRAYDAWRNTNSNLTRGLYAPGLSFNYQLASDWSISLSYRYLNQIEGKGVSATGDVFGRGGIWAQVVTNYQYEETLHQVAISPVYSINLAEGLHLGIGPSLEFNHSQAKFFVANPAALSLPGPNARFTANDYNLGGSVSLVYQLDSRWSVGAHYRFSAIKARELHSVGLQAGLRF